MPCASEFGNNSNDYASKQDYLFLYVNKYIYHSQLVHLNLQ